LGEVSSLSLFNRFSLPWLLTSPKREERREKRLETSLFPREKREAIKDLGEVSSQGEKER